MDQKLSAVQNLLNDLSDQNLRGFVGCYVNADGEIGTVFYGPAEIQTLASSIITAQVHSALVQKNEDKSTSYSGAGL
jgi:hypothetical protein